MSEPKTITGSVAFDVAIIILALLFIMNRVFTYLENKNKQIK